MSHRPDPLDPAALRRSLRALLGGGEVAVEHHPLCDSTNRLCQACSLEEGITRIVVADRQSAGRGRRGRTWLSDRAGNVYVSIGLVKSLPANSLGLLPLLVGVSLAEALHDLGYRALRLKWPNDLLIDGRKLGGILIENRVLGAERFGLTVGIGLNRRLDEDERTRIERPATSLAEWGEPPTREQLLPPLLAAVIQTLRDFEPAHADAWLRRFGELDAFAGQEVTLIDGERHLRGRNLGPDARGRLRLEIDGRAACFDAAEISLRGADHAAA